MDINTALFSFFRSAICETSMDEGVIDFCRDVEALNKICVIAKSHDLLHLIATVLNQNKMLKKTETNKKMEQQLFMAVYRYEQIKYSLGDICEILEQSGIPHIPLKGSVLREYYPQPWLRTSCDIDILIHKEDTSRAIKALCNANYIRQEDSTTHDCSLRTPNGVHLELHYSLEQKGLPSTDKLLQSVWEHCLPYQDKQYHFSVKNEMFVFYHIAHMAKHFIYGGCGIRPFIDLWLLKEKMVIDYDLLREMLQEAKLIDFYNSASTLADVWMSGREHNLITQQMEMFIFKGGVYGSAANSATVKAAKGEGRIRSFFKIMFLPRANLEVMYPNLHKHPALLPFYQVKRWFRFFNKDKRKHIANLTSARNQVQQDEQNSIKLLLINLGLK